jgi:hypothetical protein
VDVRGVGDGQAIILVYDSLKPVWVSGVFLHVCRGARASVLFIYGATAL